MPAAEGTSTHDARVLLCCGRSGPSGADSVSIEWRDYAIGLQRAGVSVGVIDMLAPALREEFIGTLAVANALRRVLSRSGASDPLVRLDRETARALSRELPVWIAAARSTAKGRKAPASPPPALVHLPGRLAAAIDANVLCGAWNYVWDLSEERSRSTTVLRAGDARQVQAMIVSPRPRRQGSERTLMLVVDLYDIAMWGGALWRHLVLDRVRRSFPACTRITWSVRAINDTTRLPASLLRELVPFDRLLIASRFQRQTFRALAARGMPVVQVPEAVDLEVYSPEVRRCRIAGRRRCVFLMLSRYLPSTGRRDVDWNETRKAGHLTLQAFLAEFGADEDVCLLIKGNANLEAMRRRLGEALDEMGVARARMAQLLVTGVLPARALPRLYRSVDALLCVSRGEGWGRPLMEAMAVGTPVVGTRFGGNLAYMNERNAFLVDCKEVAVSATFPTGSPGYGKWAEPSVSHLRRILRAIYQDPRTARIRAQRGQALVQRKYGRTAVGKTLANAVRYRLR